MILIIIAYALLASTFTIGKLALAYSSPILLIGIRMIIAGALLLGYQFFFNRKHFRLDKQDLWSFVQITLFHVYITYIAEFWALNRMTSTKAALFFNLAPFVTALFSYFHGKEHLTRMKVIGLIIGFVGIVPAILFERNTTDLKEIMYLSLPDVVFILCMISYSYGWTIARKLIKERHYNPLLINGVAMFLAGMGALIT